MNFLIQTYEGEVKHDFSFTLIESCNYQNWLNNNEDFKCYFTDGLITPQRRKNCIPIGSVEFVIKYLKDFYGSTPTPRNIPTSLQKPKFLKRTVRDNVKWDDIFTTLSPTETKFIKSGSGIKKYTEVVKQKDKDSIPKNDYYLVSDAIEIQSEWRAFVYKDKLVGLQNYAGDFTTFPNVSLIEEIIEVFEDAPIAYTLDVAINSFQDTIIIEVHDFFSCGLYGFTDHKVLPFMFSDWFNNFVKGTN